MQQICAVEYLAVGLVKCDHIFFSFEYLDLILIIQLIFHFICSLSYLVGDLRPTPDKAALPGDGDEAPGVGTHRHRLVIVRVAEDDVRDPNLTNLVPEIRR